MAIELPSINAGNESLCPGTNTLFFFLDYFMFFASSKISLVFRLYSISLSLFSSIKLSRVKVCVFHTRLANTICGIEPVCGLFQDSWKCSNLYLSMLFSSLGCMFSNIHSLKNKSLESYIHVRPILFYLTFLLCSAVYNEGRFLIVSIRALKYFLTENLLIVLM